MRTAGEAYTITELAQEFGLTLRTIRFYEEKGLIRPFRLGRERRYTPLDRLRLASIVRLRKLGFTVPEIADMLRMAGPEAPEANVPAEKIQEQIVMLETRKRELEHALTELRRLHESALRGAEPSS